MYKPYSYQYLFNVLILMYSQEDIRKILFEDRFCVSEQCIYNLEVLDAFNKFNEPFM